MNHSQAVLLVEDDKIDVMTIQRIFRELNITNPLIVVSNGEEALAYLRGSDASSIGVILLDLNMPRMSGLEFLSHIKADEKLKSIPVVVLTTSAHEEDIQQAYALSVAGYMVKPVDYAQFVDMMKNFHGYWTTSV